MKDSQGTERPQARGGEARTEEKATLQIAGWRSQQGTRLSTACPGNGSALRAMGDVAELYSERQHHQQCLKKKNPSLVASGEQIACARFFGEKRDGEDLC